jgi:hypothetical protein
LVLHTHVQHWRTKNGFEGGGWRKRITKNDKVFIQEERGKGERVTSGW